MCINRPCVFIGINASDGLVCSSLIKTMVLFHFMAQNLMNEAFMQLLITVFTENKENKY